MKTRVLKPLSDPCICRFHAATVGTDGQINTYTEYSKPYRFKALADEFVDAGYSDYRLKTVAVIIFE